jgi:SAM-dependent methyltransferase
MASRTYHGDPRTPEQIREHYEVERELAARLHAARREDRLGLYTEVYEELYRRIPHHRKLLQKATADAQGALVERQVRWLKPSLGPDSTFLEIGAGDCLVTFEIAKLVKKAIAVEVSETMAGHPDTPDNFELLITDGTSIPVPPNSVSVAYSQQLMEHLHPEDALEQLRNVYAALEPGGRYFCVTPNRTTGPYDISRHFDDHATCLHLKEYTIGELTRIFESVGFREVHLYVGAQGKPRTMPTWPFALLENLLAPLPRSLRIRLARPIRPRVLFSFRLLGIK